MAYEKQNFAAGQVLKAEHLNHMEDGIEKAMKSGGQINNADWNMFEERTTELIPETVMELTMSNSVGRPECSYQVNETGALERFKGYDKYILFVDGEKHECKGIEIPSMNIIYILPVQFNNADNADFFVLASKNYYQFKGSRGSHTVELYGVNIIDNPIPTRFMPEGYPKGLGEAIEILPEVELLLENSDEGAFYMPQLNLVAGESYIVKLDGVDYKCTSVVIDMDGTPVVALGNAGAVGAEGFNDTGDPFVVVDFGMDISGGIYGMVLLLTGAETATLSITLDKLEKMSPEYMPELDYVIIKSSTADSTKKFKITVDDSGTITATEV